MTSTDASASSTRSNIDPLVLQNRIAVAAAQRRKLAESLLRPPTAEELKNAKSAEQIAAEEEELWRPRPATLGAGHPIPTSASATETYNRENDLLRRRLLGQNIMKDARQRHQQRTQHQCRSRDVEDSDSSSDDGGQASRADISAKSLKKRKLRAEDGLREHDSVAATQNSGSDFDAGVGGGFVSLTTKTATPKGKKIKKEQRTPENKTISQSPNRDDDDDDESGAEATSKNIKTSSAISTTQRIGERIVVVGENKKRKKKKKKKNKGSSADS